MLGRLLCMYIVTAESLISESRFLDVETPKEML